MSSLAAAGYMHGVTSPLTRSAIIKNDAALLCSSKEEENRCKELTGSVLVLVIKMELT